MIAIREQDALFDLIEDQARRLAAEAPQLTLKHTRGECQCFPNNTMQLTVQARGGIKLMMDGTRPAKNSVDRARCEFGIFQIKRDRSEADTKPVNLETHKFTPDLAVESGVLWRDSRGTKYQSQQLCDFAFQRLYERIERRHQEVSAH
jgi:hypothetical protein